MSTPPAVRRYLILSQVYVPDPAAVGQHLHEVAAALASRGHAVRVVCASRGYDDPDQVYPKRETIDGVAVRRYGLPLFSKTNMPLRLFGSAWAMAALFFLGLFGGRADVVLFSTSPPMVGLLGVTLAGLKRAHGLYWAMDLNPDQLIATGKLRAASAVARALEWTHRTVLRRATLTVTLDRFMADRLHGYGRRPKRVMVLPPWAPGPTGRPVSHAKNPFRERHGLGDKFVVMYSGNHSPINPLQTVLDAALALRDDHRIRFAFVGGGLEKKRVQSFIAEHGLTNVLDLPYQPIHELPYSLGAADTHVVTLGADMVGIVHPCKVYGALAVGRPVLFVGPRPSHVSDLLDGVDIGRGVSHGDVAGCVAAVRELADLSAAAREAMGRAGAALVADRFDHAALVRQFCDAADSL